MVCRTVTRKSEGSFWCNDAGFCSCGERLRPGMLDEYAVEVVEPAMERGESAA